MDTGETYAKVRHLLRGFLFTVSGFLTLTIMGCNHHSNTELHVGEDADSVTADFPSPQSIEIKNGVTTITWANGMKVYFDGQQRLTGAKGLPTSVHVNGKR